MAVLTIKDGNTTLQPLSAETDAAGNLAPVHVPAAMQGDTAVPVSATAPMPVVATAGVAASDGSGTVGAGGTAQALFGGIVPTNGFLVQNNSGQALWISDTGAASAGGASIQIAANGGVFATPAGYKPAGAVSLYGGTTGQVFAARRW